MARVSDIIFCVRASNQDEDGVSAVRIMSAITPEYIPGLFTFSVILILLDLESEGEHTFFVDFLAPNGESVVNISHTLPIIPLNGNLPKEYQGINIAMDWGNVNFKMSGLYTLKVLYDGDEIGCKEIYVKGKNE